MPQEILRVVQISFIVGEVADGASREPSAVGS